MDSCKDTAVFAEKVVDLNRPATQSVTMSTTKDGAQDILFGSVCVILSDEIS
jgi:hypothetical protein